MRHKIPIVKITLIIILAVATLTFFLMNTTSEGEGRGVLSSVISMVSRINTPISISEFMKENSTDPEVIRKEMTEEQERKKAKDAENNSSEDAPTIYVDPGHGGNPSLGAVKGTTAGGSFLDGSGLTEEVNNYKIALKVKAKLESKGYNVKMSRNECGTTSAIGNAERGKEAATCDAAVFIHSNGSNNHSVYGTFNVVDKRYPNYNTKMGDTYLKGMVANGRSTAYGGYYKHQGLNAMEAYVAAGGDMSKVLYVEVGSHDHSNDMSYISSDVGHDQIADCIVAALSSEVPITQKSNGNTPTSGDYSQYGEMAECAKAWDQTGALKSGTTWAQLPADQKQAAYNHYLTHGTTGW